MKKVVLLTLLSSALLADDKLGFVFELVRHGARAPLLDEPEGYFRVKSGLLTESGMRERYLLGTWNRQRYID